MKFFIRFMSCFFLLLLNGCYYPGPHHQPPAVQPPIVQPPQPPPGVCGTIAGWGCPSGQFCDFGVGKCNMPDARGTCRTRPEMCTQQYDPVCGCNDKTYGNRCMAALAGVSVQHPGRCQDSDRPVRHRR